MKKIFTLALLMVTMVLSSFTASAYRFTVKWNIPEAIEVRSLVGATGTIYPAENGTYVVENDKSAWLYFVPLPGYYIQEVTGPEGMTANEKTVTSNSSVVNGEGMYWGKFFTDNMVSKWGEDPVINLVVAPLLREDTFTVNVENGANCISAKFGSNNREVTLANGENTVYFNPEFDKDLTLYCVDVDSFYKVTLNGTNVAKNAYFARYQLGNVTAGSDIEVRVFENEEVEIPDYTVTVQFAPGLENCINSIRDWTKGDFVTLNNDNTITVKENTDLQFNFKEDYNFSAVTFAGNDLVLNGSSTKNVRFKVTSDGILNIEGSPINYGTSTFKLTVLNPDGLNLYTGGYGKQEVSVATLEGSALTSATTIAGYEFEPAKSKVYNVEVDGKVNALYFAPADGWFVEAVLAKDGGSWDVVPSVQGKVGSTTDVYAVVRKLDKDQKVKFEVFGDASNLRLQGNSALSMSYDNPDSSFKLNEGDQVLDFNAIYDSPFSLRFYNNTGSNKVYLDGAALTPDDNGIYSVAPYTHAEGEESELMSTVSVYSGVASTTAKVTYSAKGLDLGFFYSPLRHEAASGKSFLVGTECAFKPSTPDCTIKFGDEVVYGYNEAGEKVGSLNEAGEFVFVVKKAITVTATVSKTVAITSVNPADGATLKSISEITVTVPMIDENMESMLSTDAEAIANITLTPENGTAIHASTVGEATPAYDSNWEMVGISYPVSFATDVTAAGTYTLNIPAGTFYETKWNDAAEANVRVEDGAMTAPLQATYTVNPDFKSDLDYYTLSPADGSAVRNLEVVQLGFTKFKLMDMIQVEDASGVTLSNGTESVKVWVEQNWEAMDVKTFNIMPEDQLADGDWTLTIPAGTFSFNGQTNGEITAVYHVNALNPAYPIVPVPGTLTGDLSRLVISFPGAGEVEYNDKPVSVSGENFSTQTYVVNQIGTTLDFEILFASTPYKEGEYTVTIPAGTFLVNGEESEAVTAVYQFQPFYSLTPAPDSTIEDCNEFIISFPAATEAVFKGSSLSISFYMGQTAGISNFTVEEVSGTSVPTFKISRADSEASLPLGNYMLLIEEGAFSIDGVDSPTVCVPYKLDHEVSLDWQASPEGTIVLADWGYTCAFVFDEAASVSQVKLQDIHVTINDEEIPASVYQCSAENNYLMFGFFDESCVVTGQLKIEISAGAVKVAGNDCPAISYTWNLVENVEHEAVVTPAPSVVTSVDQLGTITISFPTATSAEVFSNGITLRKTDYSYTATPEITPVDGAAVPTFELLFDPAPTTAGTYQLVARQGAFTLDNVFESPAIQIEYANVTTGIAGIGVDADENVTIVTLDGKVMYRDVPAGTVRDLEKGIYIINNKKVVVK